MTRRARWWAIWARAAAGLDRPALGGHRLARAGGPTLAETEAERRDSALIDARADPTVAAIMSRFPGARIIDVRLPELAAEPDATEPPPDPDIEDDDESL
jgi:hypothetical protein